MYRKHLFRGKRLDTKEQEWVKGGYYEHDFLVGNAQFIITYGQFVSIDPDTLGQYSSFRDKKGINCYTYAVQINYK